MKIIFMGTPDFSVPTLQALIDSDHEVVACYTQPDKPKGRGNKLQKTPVKELCEAYNIPVYQPERIRRKENVEIFQQIEADVAVVIAYGQILPASILNAPKYGCINIHASLLPKYRGAAPYQWAVINGEKTTGITTMQMDVGMDTGDMLLTAEIAIEDNETAGSLHDKLMVLGGPLILETLDKLEKNMLEPIIQDDEQATHAPLLSKEFGRIDWTKTTNEIERLIRGLYPWPSSYTYLNGILLKIYGCQFLKEDANELWIQQGVNEWVPGTICKILPKLGFVVTCKDGFLLITELQLEGKKRMDAPSFMRGFTLTEGTILG